MAGRDQAIVPCEDERPLAPRRRHLQRSFAEVVNVYNVVLLRRHEPGVTDGVHVYARFLESVEQDRFRSDQVLGADLLFAVEDAADQADFHDVAIPFTAGNIRTSDTSPRGRSMNLKNKYP